MLSNLIVLFSIIMSRWILPFIQVNELACHSSRDTDRRRETPGSEKSDFMIPPILGRAETSASFLCSHIMGGFMGSQIKPVWTVYCTLRGFCTQRDPEFTESVIFMFIIFAQNETLSQLFSISRCTNIQKRKKKKDLGKRAVRALQYQCAHTRQNVGSPWQITSQQWFIKSIHIHIYSNLRCAFFSVFNSMGSSMFFSSSNYPKNVSF